MDDNIFTDAPAVRAWSGLWNIWFSPTDIEIERHYWPILYTTFWLEHKLWGITPFGTHLVNLLLYMVNVLLLHHLLRRLSVPGSWAVAAVFALHPMHVESVAWAIGRKDLLCGLFCMACTLCWIRSADGGDDGPSQSLRTTPIVRPGLYVAALGLLVAAMLSKSVAVTLPVVFAILLWWKNGRVTGAEAWRIAPFFLVALCIALADLSYYSSGPDFSSGYGPVEKVTIAARALCFYAGKLVWPANLAVIYPLWDIEIGDVLSWGCVIVVVAVGVGLWYGRHRLGRGPFAGFAFFAVVLSPTLGFVDFAYMRLSLVADRYAYLAGIGVISVLIGAAASRADGLSNQLRLGAWVLLVAVLAVFGKLTWDQAWVYQDRVTFYSHITSANPEVPMYRNLADALRDAGRLEEALTASRIGLEQRPDAANAHNTHGATLFAMDRLEEAANSFHRALQLHPGQEHALRNMALTRKRQGRLVESLRWYRQAIDNNPESALAQAGMGEVQFRLGQHKMAAELLENAIALRPDSLPLSTHHFLAEALRQQQRHEEAITKYRDVLEIDPEFAYAHAGIGYALRQLKRYEEALEWLARSISLEPQSPAAADRHVEMGRALEALNQTEDAARHYKRALEIDPRSVSALDSLALMRFRQQRYEDALGMYETLIGIDGDNAQFHVNKGLTLQNLDRREEALRSFQRAVSLDPNVARIEPEETADAFQQERQ